MPGEFEEAETILASVQPAQLSDYDMLEPLPEGRRVESLVRVYTNAELVIAGDDALASGDVLDWPATDCDPGRPYVFIARSPWQSGVISHYRYLAARMPIQR